MKQIFLILTILSFIVGCSSEEEPKSDKSLDQDKAFTIINNGSLSGSGEENISKSNMVIDNTNDWQHLIDKMNSINKVSDDFSEVAIDFDNYLVIAVFLEVKSSGWDLKITSITENDSRLVVATSETPLINSVITQPFSIVKIDKTEKPIEFDEFE